MVLEVYPNYDAERFDRNKYESFLDALCGDREYQKEAIRETARRTPTLGNDEAVASSRQTIFTLPVLVPNGVKEREGIKGRGINPAFRCIGPNPPPPETTQFFS